MAAARPLSLLSVLALLVAGCASPGAEEIIFQEGFEDDLSSWETGADVPDDPNRPGEKVDWEIDLSTDQRHGEGDQSVMFRLDGSQDDGTIWIVRPVEVGAQEIYKAEVTAFAWSASESFNHLADLVLYLGTTPPGAEGDFPRGENGSSAKSEDGNAGGIREALNAREGWARYDFNWTTPLTQSDTLYVAVGISVVWETEVTYYVDNLAVRLIPQSTGGAGGVPY